MCHRRLGAAGSPKKFDRAGEIHIASLADLGTSRSVVDAPELSGSAVRWTCARCDVSVGMIDGGPSQLPATWSRSGDSTFCLACSRAEAGDAALDSAPAASSREERVRLRRDAVIEFEVARTPEAPNRAIANACHTSAGTVKTVRDALEGTSPADPSVSPGALSAG